MHRIHPIIGGGIIIALITYLTFIALAIKAAINSETTGAKAGYGTLAGLMIVIPVGVLAIIVAYSISQ